jgi:hypothetical protein
MGPVGDSSIISGGIRCGKSHRKRLSGLVVAVLICGISLIGGPVGHTAAQTANGNSEAESDTMEQEPLLLSIHGLPGYGVAPLTTGFVMTTPVDPTDPIVSYQWNLGDGTVVNGPPPAVFHTYRKPGIYTVTVSVTTASGRTAMAMTPVVVRPPSD